MLINLLKYQASSASLRKITLGKLPLFIECLLLLAFDVIKVSYYVFLAKDFFL